MLDLNVLMLLTGFLVFASIVATRVAGWLGLPTLIVFLGIGMLAGSDGLIGVQFDNTELAGVVGTIALAYILFSGGLDTNWQIIRPVLRPGGVLATIGVVITALLMAVFAWGALGMNLQTSLLLGAIISSTDAAAVFSILRSKGVGLKGNLKPLLELESGSNDPMAIFLTMGMTQLIMVPDFDWTGLPTAFVINMVGGVLVGFLTGKIAGVTINRLRLDYEGLYPVLTISLVLLTFGLAQAISANGFLAVYVCGILLNATDFAHKRYLTRFHDALAWLMQIGMFIVLGLLVFPSELPEVAGTGIAAALFLMLVARPVAVAIGLWRTPFTRNERLLTAWTGLRGAVPIVLATFPLSAGFEHSAMVFNVVFFVVVTSVVIQGSLLMPFARLLRVDEPLASRRTYSFELERNGQVQGDTREIEVLPNMYASGKTIANLELPPDVLVLLIGRGDGFVVPRGNTRVEPYDTLLLLGDPESMRVAEQTVVSFANRPRPVTAVADPLSALPQSTEAKYLSKQVVVVGYGRVGRHVCEALAAQGVPYVVADENREIIEKLRATGVPAVVGDASTAIVLAQAHVQRAAILVIATPNTMKVRQIVETARAINPAIAVMVRSHSEVEAAILERENVGELFIGERELARNITARVMQELEKV